MTRISRMGMLMGIAEVIAKRGTCSRAQVGCVLSKEGRIISTGYNGAPSRMKHCVHNNNSIPCEEAIHAETNAIAFAAKHGLSTDCSTLVTTSSPCPTCAKIIINAGILKVVFRDRYRLPEGIDILVKAGVMVEQFD